MVRQVSAAHVRHFAEAMGKLAKTDPIDARMIARFMAFKPSSGRKLAAKKLRLLNVLVTKRSQIISLRKNLSCQIKQRGSTLVDDLDLEQTSLLNAQIARLDDLMSKTIQEDAELDHKARCLALVPGV